MIRITRQGKARYADPVYFECVCTASEGGIGHAWTFTTPATMIKGDIISIPGPRVAEVGDIAHCKLLRPRRRLTFFRKP